MRTIAAALALLILTLALPAHAFIEPDFKHIARFIEKRNSDGGEFLLVIDLVDKAIPAEHCQGVPGSGRAFVTVAHPATWPRMHPVGRGCWRRFGDEIGVVFWTETNKVKTEIFRPISKYIKTDDFTEWRPAPPKAGVTSK